MSETSLNRAADNALEALAEANAELAGLHRKIDATARRRSAVLAGLTGLMKALPTARQAEIARKMNGYVPGLTRREHGAGPVRMAAVMERLATWPGTEIRPRDLQLSLESAGYEIPRRYGATTLSALNQTAHVSRTGRGIYRINQSHPDLAAARDSRVPEASTAPADEGLAQMAARMEREHTAFLATRDINEIKHLRGSTPEQVQARSDARRARMEEIRRQLDLPRGAQKTG